MKNPGNAAVLSLLIPGVGQIYNGKFLRRIFWLIITTRPAFGSTAGRTLGWLCHLISAYTAYRFASRNQYEVLTRPFKQFLLNRRNLGVSLHVNLFPFSKWPMGSDDKVGCHSSAFGFNSSSSASLLAWQNHNCQSPVQFRLLTCMGCARCLKIATSGCDSWVLTTEPTGSRAKQYLP